MSTQGIPGGRTLWDRLSEFQEKVASIQERARNPRDRQILAELLEQIATSKAEAQAKLPVLLDELRQQAEEFKAQAEAAQAELARQVKQAEELQKQAAERDRLAKLPKARPPAAPIDPALGARLRGELLSKLDQAGATQPARRLEQREAWQDWEGFESRRGSAAAPAPLAPATPPVADVRKPAPLATPAVEPPKPQPATDHDEEIWKGLSRAGESSMPAAATPPPEAEPTLPPPAKPAPPTNPPPKTRNNANDEIWDGLSRAGE